MQHIQRAWCPIPWPVLLDTRRGMCRAAGGEPLTCGLLQMIRSANQCQDHRLPVVAAGQVPPPPPPLQYSAESSILLEQLSCSSSFSKVSYVLAEPLRPLERGKTSRLLFHVC